MHELARALARERQKHEGSGGRGLACGCLVSAARVLRACGGVAAGWGSGVLPRDWGESSLESGLDSPRGGFISLPNSYVESLAKDQKAASLSL